MWSTGVCPFTITVRHSLTNDNDYNIASLLLVAGSGMGARLQTKQALE